MTPTTEPRDDGAMNSWRRLLCRLGLHSHYRKRGVSESVDLIGCEHCSREWGMHHGMKLVAPWTDEMAEFYKRIVR